MLDPLEPRLLLAANVTINEFMAANISGLRDETGQVADWIEIRNSGDTTARLLGWHLTDSPSNLNKWTFPDVTLGAGQSMVVFADNADRRDVSRPLHTNFQLDAAGEYLALVAPDGVTKASEFASYPKQQEDISYGYDGNLLRYFAAPTPGAPNQRAEVVINEINYDPDVKTELTEFIELYNPGSAAVNLAGATISGGISYTFPAGTVLQPNGYLVIAQNPAAFQTKFGKPALGPFAGGLGNSGDDIIIRNAGGGKLDEVNYGAGFPWPTVGDPFNNVAGSGPSIELINPNLDNNLGGNWRQSLIPVTPTETTLIPQNSTWDYRKGTSEASTPIDAWRGRDFIEDSTWFREVDGQGGVAPIGYNEYATTTINTTLSDMRYGYVSLFMRKTFTVADPSKIGSLRIDAFYDDGFDVWINGVRVTHANVTGNGDLAYDVAGGTPNPGGNARGKYYAPSYETLNMIDAPDPASYLVAGTNVIAVQLRNVSRDSSGDAFFDCDLIASPIASPTTFSPTPGAPNSAYAANAAPDVRQVSVNGGSNSPVVLPDTPVTITAKVTDPNGVSSVNLDYQIVDPGNYINIADSAYETNWTTMPMRDDGLNGDAVAGDGIFTAVLPAGLQVHRRLVRYRLIATDTLGSSIRTPYTDDASPNFAYYVYAGVPGWTGAVQPGITNPITYSADVMNSIQPFQLITKQSDAEDSTWYQQYDYNDNSHFWYGTVVYNGQVYDHITYRPRGGCWRYAMGKNMWKFSFNRNHEFQGLDDYGNPLPTTAKEVNFGACIQQGNYGNRGEQGLYESVSFKLFNLAGVPAPRTTFMQFRVVDNVSEFGTTQYNGDLWGLYLSNEEPDGNFLDSHDLPDGNLYKMDTEPGTGAGGGDLRNQGPTQAMDNSDLVSFVNGYNNSSQTDQWFIDNLNLDEYYSYRAIVEGIHQGDIGYGKNYYYYHDPTTNQWSVIPWDTDLTWAETMYGNGDEPLKSRVLSRTAFDIAYQNRLREIIDLLFNPEQVDQLIDEMAAKIYTPGEPSFVDVDRSMWDYNPIMISGYVNSGQAGQGRFYQAGGGTFAGMIQKMKDYVNYALTQTRNWYGTSGPSMTSLAYDPAIPNQPTASWLGGASHPVNALTFRSSSFSSPVGTGYAATEWRIAEITDPSAPGYDPKAPKHYEIQSSWDSGECVLLTNDITIPGDAVQVGHTYRVRVRFKDSTGRWSDWSEPVQFVADAASSTVKDSLRIVEMNYNPDAPPAGSPYSRSDFEFIELKNTGAQTINLYGVKFTNGIDFTFPYIDLLPGQSIVISPNLNAFKSRYPSFDMKLTGQYSGHLDDGGERIVLQDSLGQTILDFRYDNSWYSSTDGNGKTLVVRNPGYTSGASPDPLSDPANWRASTYNNGTPGADECTLASHSIVFNEILTHTDAASGDWIELYNTTDADIPIGGWWLSDDYSNPQKFQIPANTVIKAHNYAVFTAAAFGNSVAARIPFALDEAGEQVILSSASAFGVLSGWDEKQAFDAAEKDVTLGRYLASTGPQFVALSSPTPGESNSDPKVGPIVINEIMYAPAAGGDEYIELRNITSAAVPLYDPAHPENTWRFTGDIQFNFVAGNVLQAGEIALLVGIDPAAFRAKYNIPASVQIFGPYVGLLDDIEDTLTLSKPSDVEPGMPIAYITVDRIHYTSNGSWPAAVGSGASLSRVNSQIFGDDPLNWQAEMGGSPGMVNFDHTPPALAIAPVSPDPHAGPVDSLTLTFSEPISGFDISDLSLTRDGQAVSLTSANLTQLDSTTWTLSGLASLTGRLGRYALSLTAAGSGIADLAGNALAADASESFINNRLAGQQITLTASAHGLLQVQVDSDPSYSLALAGLPAIQLSAESLRLVGQRGDAVQINPGQIAFAQALMQYDVLPALDLADLSVNVGPTSLGFTADQHLASLSIAAGGSVALGSGSVLLTNQLTLAPDSTLDLANGTLIIQATAQTAGDVLTQVNSAITSARNTSPLLWKGTGITSSAARDDASRYSGLAAVLNQDVLGNALYSTFAGQAVDVNSILVKYTLNGDADLSGKVDGADYFLIDMGYLSKYSTQPLKGYYNGDFDYNGLVDGADYFLIDVAYLSQYAVASAAAPLAASASPFNSTHPITPSARSLLVHHKGKARLALASM